MAGPAFGSFPPPAAAPSRAPIAEPPVIGKRELLQWVNDVLGDIGEDVDFSTLRFGHVFLRLFEIIWPDAVRALPSAGNLHPETPADVAANWEAIEGALQRVGVPLSFVNQSLIRIGNFGACYQSLVFLFFLYCLARDHECEFVLAHSVEPSLTEFMSSEAPLACLVSGGAVDVPHPIRERIMTPRAPSQHTDGKEGDTEERGATSVSSTAQTQSLPVDPTLPSLRCEALDPQCEQQLLQQAKQLSDLSVIKDIQRPEGFSSAPSRQSEQSSSVPQVQQKLASSQQARVVGGAFTKDGIFCSGQTGGALPQDSVEKQQACNRRDAHVQTQPSSHLEIQDWQLPPPHAPLEWCGEGQKIKGEQLIEMLRYQNGLLKQQLERAADEAAAVRRHHAQQIRDMKEATAVELQRIKEKCNADLLDQQAKHSSAIQAMRHQLDMRIRQIEDDVTMDVEVLCSSSTIGCLAHIATREGQQESADKNISEQDSSGHQAALMKVQKLQELMDERLRARDAAASETKQLLQETLEQCAAYRRESDSRWNQWKRCEDLKESIVQIVSKTGQLTAQTTEGRDQLTLARQALNDEVQKLLEQSGFPVPLVSTLEQKLLAVLVECLCLQHAQDARHRQKELELTRLIHQAQQSQGRLSVTSGGIATMQNELLLEEQVRRLEAQNQRLLRTSEYLRLKVEHLGKWRVEDAAFIQQCQESRQSAAGAAQSGSSEALTRKEATQCADILENGAEELPIPPSLLQQDVQALDRDSELLHVLKSLGRPSKSTLCDAVEGQCSSLTNIDDERGKTTENNVDNIRISAATKNRLLQLFWLLLGDFYKFKARLEEAHHQLRHMQQLVRTTVMQKLSVQQAAEKERTEVVCSFEKRIQRERCSFQKAIGRSLVKLLAAQEQVEEMRRLKNKQEDEHEALLQVLHQADNKRFNAILAKLHSMEMTNRVLQKREQFWDQLAKALSMQLRSPSDQTQRAIQDLWAQLVGSKALIASDVLKLSSESLSLQLRGTAKTSKERENTPRPTPSRPAPGSVTTPTAKQNSRSGTRLSHRHSSNPTSAQKAAGKARGPSAGRRDSLLISSEQPAAEIADSLGPADSFAKCLREICCQAACDEENNGASGLGSCNLEISFDIMEPVNESDDDAIAPAEAFSDQLLPWRRQIFSESETQETPKDWVNLLKVMAQEATALFRKHKTLKDKEVEELKRERETHLEKCQKLMLQLSDQQSLCTSFREQQDFFRQQHQLALESLERVQQEKATMEMEQRQTESELRRESAELRIGQAELRRILSAIATYSADTSYIMTLCAPLLDGSAASKTRVEARPEPTSLEEVHVSCEASGTKAGSADVPHLPSSPAGTSIEYKQEAHSSSAGRRMSASSFPAEAGMPCRQVIPSAATEPQSRTWDATTSSAYHQKEILRVSCPAETQASTNETLGSGAGHAAVSTEDLSDGPTSRDEDANGGRHQGEEGADYAKIYGLTGERSPSNSATPICTTADLLDDRGDRCYMWSDEINRVLSTTAPTPRSPPRAALAPLISPSRLVQALRMHMRTPKDDRQGDRCQPGTNHVKEETGETTPAGLEGSLRQQTASTLLHKSLFVAEDSASHHTSVTAGPTRSLSAEAVQQRPAERVPEHQVTSGAEHGTAKPQGVESSSRYHVEMDRPSQRNSSRAAAEQAWEDFVGSYGAPSRKQPASFPINKHVPGWKMVKTPTCQRGANLLDSDSSRENFGPGLRQKATSIIRRHDTDTCIDGDDTSLTRETTDSALQDVLSIEQGLKEEELGDFCIDRREKPNLLKHDADDAFISDDTNQLGISATAFLRRLGSQLETRMRASSSKQPHLN